MPAVREEVSASGSTPGGRPETVRDVSILFRQDAWKPPRQAAPPQAGDKGHEAASRGLADPGRRATGAGSSRRGGRRTAYTNQTERSPDRPSSSLFELTAVPAARERLRMGGQKWPTAGRPCGFRPKAPTLHPCGGESKSLGLACQVLSFCKRGVAMSAIKQYGLRPGSLKTRRSRSGTEPMARPPGREGFRTPTNEKRPRRAAGVRGWVRPIS